eukprot:GHVL01007813.1.p1 GENE.GHVL01007813.1~~GHVL01007813.1.p1  ORF type:complete len:605 (-),score=104.03 GHVL01007813.1:461-2275(-)
MTLDVSATEKYVPPHQRRMAAAAAGNVTAEEPKMRDDRLGGWGDNDSRTTDNRRRLGGQDYRQGRQTGSQAGTGWDTRDGRRTVFEQESDVFDNTNSTGINFDSYDNIPVEQTGNNIDALPKISLFADAKAHKLLQQNVDRLGYQRPTPVQKYAIPVIISHRDLMACAQTGSGKTAAFLFPVIACLLEDGPPGEAPPSRRRRALPVAMILSPTRELASQIFEESRKFCYKTGILPAVVYGGNNQNQWRELQRGCDILVATPGRLCDLMERGSISLQCIKYLVFDEADRMLDMGFEAQIRTIVEQNDMPTIKQGRKTVMFSATFPKEIQELAGDFLTNYIFLTVGRVGSTLEYITQSVLFVEQSEKTQYLKHMLKESTDGLTLVFVETKRQADRLEEDLYNAGYDVASIHGDRTQQEREEALRSFKQGETPILVATDVAARGLDIANVRHVINYDLPSHIDDYVHRIGRTGRAGNTGKATSLVNDQNRPILRELCKLLDEAGQDVPRWFQTMVQTASTNGRYGGGGGNRYGKGRGGSYRGANFGSRDSRKDQSDPHHGGGGGYESRWGGDGGGGGRNNNSNWRQDFNPSSGYGGNDQAEANDACL